MDELKWKDFSEKERWKVWWGVAWRGAMVYLGVTLLFMLFVLIASE